VTNGGKFIGTPFFDILEIRQISHIVELLKKIHFGSSTTFQEKSTIFAKVNLLRIS